MPIYGQWYATVKYNENRYFLPIIRDERVVRGEGVVNRLGGVLDLIRRNVSRQLVRTDKTSTVKSFTPV